MKRMSHHPKSDWEFELIRWGVAAGMIVIALICLVGMAHDMNCVPH